ncbi:MAG: beta-L-arabinofuranosidase domain-containing protein, partial [Lacibacter sp.]
MNKKNQATKKLKQAAAVCAFALTAFGAFAQDKITNVKRPSTKTANTFYTGNRLPLQPLSFVKLPAGSVKPGGWVLKYLELQRDGLTGQLGSISAWLEKNNNAWFSNDGKGDHGWEEVPYWLKGYGNLGYALNDATIIAETKLWLNKVFESQQPDGYFGPKLSPNDRKEIPDLWPNMLMLWTLQSYYEYTNDTRVIPFMLNYSKWLMNVPDEKLLKTYWENSRGGDNLYSVYWLYNRTGEKWLLDLAHKIHRNTADWNQKNNLPNWHNVNVAQCFREPATYYMQTKDSNHLKATYNDFFLIRTLYGQVPGGMFGADENARRGFDDPRQAVETCGLVEQMASNELLVGITGDPFWADHCENVAFNSYPAAVMPDFKGLRYLTAPNMAVSDSRNHAPGIQNEGPFLMMNPFSSRCCQHNHAMGWPYYNEHLWMATPDNGIVAMLYSESEVNAKVGSGKGTSVTLKQSTHYP